MKGGSMAGKLSFFTLLLVVLVSCAPISTEAIPSATNISTLTPVAVTQPIPTNTLQPTITPEITATLNPYQVESKATEQALIGLKSIFPGICDYDIWSIQVSPDGNWLAQDCGYDSLQIIKRDGIKSWRVTYEEIFGDSENYPYNQGSLHPLHWTNDSQYLYFSAISCCWDPFIFMLSETTTLYRLNINNGAFILTRSGLFDLSFAPTDRRLTIIEELHSPPSVEIQDLLTGEFKTVKLDVNNTYNQAKVDIWSKDGLKFAVKTVSGINYSYDVLNNDMFSLIVIDVNDISQKTILKDFETLRLEVLDWTNDDILVFQTGDEYLQEPIVTWQYDLKTDTLIAPALSP